MPSNKVWPFKPHRWLPKENLHFGTSNCNNNYNTYNSTSNCSNNYNTNKSNNSADGKWVKNLAGVPLTKTRVSLLAHGPNFTVAPRHSLYGEYIATVDQACQSLDPHEAEEFRAEIRGALKHSHTFRKNITKEETQALAELRTDQSRVILTADIRVVLVVLDRT